MKLPKFNFFNQAHKKPNKVFNVITLFPDACRSYTDTSILKRAAEDNLIAVNYYNPRDFTKNMHHRIDQKPYGGGPGMVLEAEPFLLAWKQAIRDKKNFQTIFFSPAGKQFDQNDGIEMANAPDDYIFICGRYEGIDQRVVDITGAKTYSIGPYVLTGGELPALIMIDAISRQLPGVLGDYDSLEENRIASSSVYTRPESLSWEGKNYDVPPVLLSGNHAEIDKWRQSVELESDK